MGLSANKPHEPGALSDLFPQAKSNSSPMQDRLNNLRNSFTFVANLLVLALGLTAFTLMNNQLQEYRFISCTIVGIGLLASLFFLLALKEKPLVQECQKKKSQFRKKIKSSNSEGH